MTTTNRLSETAIKKRVTTARKAAAKIASMTTTYGPDMLRDHPALREKTNEALNEAMENLADLRRDLLG